MTWIIKNVEGKYFQSVTFFVSQQSLAHRFADKEIAEATLDRLNCIGHKAGNKARIVKLKTCQEKNKLTIPKMGTAFLDVDSAIVHIVHSVTDDPDYPELIAMDAFHGKDVWDVLSRYHEDLKSGDIRILWEPEH